MAPASAEQSDRRLSYKPKKLGDVYKDAGESLYPDRVETELELTRRLLEGNHSGMKGLVYVLHELRNVKAAGTIKGKTRVTKEDKSVSSRIAGIIQRNKCKTRITQQERDRELIVNLRNFKNTILESLMRE